MRIRPPVLCVSLFAIAGLSVATSGCDLVNDVAEQLNIPIEFSHTVGTAADISAVTGSLAGQTTPQDASYPVSPGAIPVDLISQSAELAANRDKVRRLELTALNALPKANTLSAALPEMTVYVGPKGATEASEGVRIATIPSIPAGSTATVTVAIDAAGMDAAQPHLMTFDFVVMLSGTLEVKSGETVPSGKLDIDLTMDVKATLNPTQ